MAESTDSGVIRLGPFDLVDPVAKGAMGKVWRARHRTQDELVAIKFLHAHIADDEWALESFRNEVRAAAALNHPGIVTVLDHGLVDPDTARRSNGLLVAGSPYFAMELVDGQPLQKHIGRHEWPVVHDVMLQLLNALAHSHAVGVIHRDLKPGNVLLVEDRTRVCGYRAMLTDFGLAQALARRSSADEVVAGTPAYMAPEQLVGEWRDQGPWTDLYSLGCLAWAFVSRLPPFGRKREFSDLLHDHLHLPPPELEPKVAVPEAFERWLLRLLQKRPEDRFGSACEAAVALMAIDAELPDDDSTIPPIQGATRAAGDGLLDAVTQAPATLPQLPTRALSPLGTARQDAQTEAMTSPFAPSKLTLVEVEIVDEPDTTGRAALPRLPVPVPANWRGTEAPRVALHLRGVGLNLYGLRAVRLVGREAERDQLWSALRVAVDTGRPSAVVLRGPAGCGKSRLAEWLVERAQVAAGALALSARWSPERGDAHELARMMAGALRCQGMDRADLRERLGKLLPRLGMGDEENVEVVLDLLLPAVEEQASARLAGAPERHALVARLIAQLRGASAPRVKGDHGRPVVLWLDDVHYSTESLAFAEAVLDRAELGPVLLVLTVQDAMLADRALEQTALQRVARRPGVREILLDALPERDHAELVHELLGMEGELADRVARRTAGNPLFAVQLVGDWVSRGILEAGKTGFKLKPGARAEFPDDLHQVWRDRIERVLHGYAKPAVRAMELAAILGIEVNEQEWLAVCGLVRSQPDRALVGAMIEAQLARGRPEGQGFAFAHPMVREALERRARDQRLAQRMHLACAQILRRKLGSAPGIIARVGRHELRGGHLGPALVSLLEGAREGLRYGDHDEVRRLLADREQAMKRVRLPTEDSLWGEGWLVRTRLAVRTMDLSSGEHWCERTLESARRYAWTSVRARALLERGVLHRHRGRPLRAWRRLRQAEEEAVLLADDALLAEVAREQARLLIELGKLERAHTIILRAAALAERSGDLSGQAASAHQLGLLAKQSGDLDAAAHFTQRALDLHRQAGGRSGVAHATNELGELARIQGDLEAAERHYRDAARRMEDLGVGDLLIPRVNLGLVLQERGRWAEAEPLLLNALQAFEARGQPALVATVRALLLPCLAERGAGEAFDGAIEVARIDLQRTGFVDQDIATAASRAGQRWGRHDPVRARAAYQLALAQWEALGRPERVDEILLLLATLPGRGAT